MRIRYLSIRNFRGIRELDWALPAGNVVCLAGSGDATKSTILEAIRRVLHPQWNLVFDDADFYDCKPTNEICIEAILGDIPNEFRDLAAYGYWLSGWDLTLRQRRDDPVEGLEDVVRVRLAVGSNLEPSWQVVKDGDGDGLQFKATDRLKAAVSLIGATSNRELTWSRGSILTRLTKQDDMASPLVDAARAAKTALEHQRTEKLGSFDSVAALAQKTAVALGVVVNTQYKAHLDSDALNVRVAGLTLHDGDMPLRQLGLGSKRMLTTGLQKEALKAPHITLFDEVEVGLEPHRIARLLQHLKEDTRGQYLLTTHSPVVLRELTIADLHIVHKKGGKTTVVAADIPAMRNAIQGKIRSGAEAFLAPKIAVCEGATEAGLLRGLDTFWLGKAKKSFAYQGVTTFDADGASKIKGVAEALKKLAYDVAVIADSDALDQFSEADASALGELGVAVIMWPDGMSVEERFMADLPWPGVLASLDAAMEAPEDAGRRLDQVQSKYGAGFNRNRAEWSDDAGLRTAIGKAAHAGSWFKSVSRGQRWVKTIAPHLDDAGFLSKPTAKKLQVLRAWIDRD